MGIYSADLVAVLDLRYLNVETLFTINMDEWWIKKFWVIWYSSCFDIIISSWIQFPVKMIAADSVYEYTDEKFELKWEDAQGNRLSTVFLNLK